MANEVQHQWPITDYWPEPEFVILDLKSDTEEIGLVLAWGQSIGFFECLTLRLSVVAGQQCRKVEGHVLDTV